MPGQDTMPQVALIGLIAVFLLFGGLGFYSMSELGSEQKPESLAAVRAEKLQEERRTLDEIAVLEGKIAQMDLKTVEQDWAIKLQGDQLGRLKMARANFLMRRDLHSARTDSLESTRRKVETYYTRGDPSEADSPSLQSIRRRKEDMEQRFSTRRSDLQARIDDAQKELTKAKNRYARRYEEKRNVRSRLNTELAQAKDELAQVSAGDHIEVDVTCDGVVLNSDVESRLVVINIGEQQGVKRGMRFEVFQLRGGSRHVHKGYIDVRSVSRETSSCIIIERKIRLPRCPACGYIGTCPEEQFCPSCTGGGILFQRLRASPRESSLGMNPHDPILVGDLLRNPLFDPDMELRFAVKGDPLHTSFGTEDLMAAIRWHGGVIDPDVGAQTDVLLAGKWATEESRKARELGIRVLHHYELFNFLRK